MTDELFAVLETKGITSGQRAFEVIAKLDYDEVLELAVECFAAVKDVGLLPENKLFTFAPVSSIAGGPSPCSSVSCRLEAAYSLSLISALYADKIILPNFFDYMYPIIFGEASPPDTEDGFSQFAYNLASDIAVCFEYKPLFDAGLAVMNYTTPAVCKDCHKKHLKESADFQKELDKVLKDVEPKLRKNVRFIYEEDDYIAIQNDNNYLGGDLGWSVGGQLLAAMRKHDHEVPYTLSEPEVVKFGLRQSVIDTTVNDIMEYDFYPSLNAATYLTNRQFDIDLIEGTKKRPGSSGSTRGLPAYHKIPYLQDILIEDAVALRQAEEESFRVYRNAVAEMVKKNDEAEAEAYAASVLEPAIDKINNIIVQNKKHYRAVAGKKIKTRSIIALAGIGAANLLNVPVGFVTGALGTAGLLTAHDIIDDLQASRMVSPEVRQDPFYFLWGIKQTHAESKAK